MSSQLTVLQLSRWVGAKLGGGIQTYLQCLGAVEQQHALSFHHASLLYSERPDFAHGKLWAGERELAKWQNALRLWRWLWQEVDVVDVVHVHGVTDWHFLLAVIICGIKRKPFVVSAHGSLMPEALEQISMRGSWLRRAAVVVVLRLLRRAELVITSSQRERAALQRLDSRIRTRVVLPGVPPLPRSSAKQESEGLRLAFLGRVEPIKALSTLLEAVELLVARGLPVRLDVIGDHGTAFGQAEKAGCDGRAASANVRWRGHLQGDVKWQELGQAQLLVMPSRSESFGFAAAECLAMGIPVLVSDGVGLAEVVEASGAGTVFPVGDAQALSDAIEAYLDVDYRRERSEAALRCARERLSLTAMGEAMNRLYLEVAATVPLVSADS